MKRRRLLSAVAAGSVAGCVSTSQVPPRIVGIDSRHVDTYTCGEPIRKSCESTDQVDRLIDQPVQIQKNLAGGAIAYRDGEHLIVRGYITANDDPTCADGRISLVEREGNTISVTVRNRHLPLMTCAERVGRIDYRIVVYATGDSIENVQITHYTHEQDVMLSDSIHL